MTISITSIRANGGDGAWPNNGSVYIQGTDLVAGHIYAIYSGGTVGITGLSWNGTYISGNPSYLDILDGESGQIMIQNAAGEVALFPVTFKASFGEDTIHGFFLDNIVTTTGKQYAPPYNYPHYGSIGRISTYTSGGPMGVEFAELFMNPDGSQDLNWSAEYTIPLNQLARIGAPIRTMLKKQGTWNLIMNGGGQS